MTSNSNDQRGEQLRADLQNDLECARMIQATRDVVDHPERVDAIVAEADASLVSESWQRAIDKRSAHAPGGAITVEVKPEA
jgi:hypothetical protein